MDFSTWDVAIALMITVICVYIFCGSHRGQGAVTSFKRSVTRHFRPPHCDSEALPDSTEHHHHHHHNRLSGFSADEDGDFAPFSSRHRDF